MGGVRTGVEENIYTYNIRIMEGWRKMHNESLHNLYLQ